MSKFGLVPGLPGEEPTVEEREATATLAVQQTLAEQMRFTNYEIEDRKRLLGIGEYDVKLLTACRSEIVQRVDSIIEEFYSTQIKSPEIALLIGDIETLSRLKRAMRGYIVEMFDGQYDVDYVNKRLRIGKVHKRIGVSPKLYTSALRILHELLERELDAIELPGNLNAAWLRRALYKIFMFDIQLVFDTYIASLFAEVDSKKDELERYAANLEQQVIDRTLQLAELSRQDKLTGLYNQMAFQEHLSREIALAERSGAALCLVYVDLNDFKLVNDTKGHAAGDQVLAATGRLLRESTRASDVICRYGGDEFCIIMPRTSLDDAKSICERVLKAASKMDGKGSSLSIGVAQFDPEGGMTKEQFIEAADSNMYKAKKQSKEATGNVMVA